MADARTIEGQSFEGTGYSYTLSLIQGKHKMPILYCLMEYQPVRFNEMRRYLGNVTDRTLSANLKELEADGLVARRAYQHPLPLRELGRLTVGRFHPLWRVLVTRGHRIIFGLQLFQRHAQVAGVLRQFHMFSLFT